jgi:DNA/RNA endonuclease YhcR with UshA esterase domain
MKSRTALTIGALTLVATVAVAHHTTAGIYDIKSEVEVKGKVKEWRFANPHPLLKIEVVDAKGAVQEWDVSYGGSAVSHLKKRGYSAQTFKAGDIVIVKGHPTLVKEAHGLLIETSNPTHEDGTPYP